MLPQVEDFIVKNLNGNKFMGGDHPMYIDMHCYPFLERLVLLENSPMKIGWEKLELEKLIPAIKEYVGRFRNHPYMT